LIQIAIMLVAVYTILVLGTFSHMHCRLVVSLMGLFCVGLSYAAGFGFSFYCGGETAGVHNLMPFLLIGIGVDDMFVICNAVDQTDLFKPANERIREAMKHAGPSITITSLTNTLAFAFGGLNSLTSLRSFCLFAAACVMMLYLVVMSVFLCVVIWDTERVGRKKGECCGLFMCKMDSIFCCRGSCLSAK
jgi:Niemann-Pick C1 protein